MLATRCFHEKGWNDFALAGSKPAICVRLAEAEWPCSP